MRQPPSGGCVLKLKDVAQSLQSGVAAAFGRLCVETRYVNRLAAQGLRSRLRAAVC